MSSDIRWQQRLDNFDRALTLLGAALKVPVEELSPLEQEGVVHRFEYTFELAWKTLQDHLEAIGLDLNPVAPRNVIKQGFAARVLTDGATWIAMLEHRTQIAHLYNAALLAEVPAAIAERYLPALREFHTYCRQRSSA